MTITVLELISHLKPYPRQTVVVLKDVNDEEFAIVDFQSENSTLNILIGKVEYKEESEESEDLEDLED